jgi:hypothetical protein
MLMREDLVGPTGRGRARGGIVGARRRDFDPLSMNRTGFVAALVLATAVAPARAQGTTPAAAAKAQAGRIDELVGAMRGAEARLRTIALELATTSRLQADVVVTTTGTLRVVRGEQAAFHTRFEHRTADGQRGRTECAQTAAGIHVFEESAAAGEVFVHIEPAIVADLEWAGRVLQREDLPGMVPVRQADAPLGSAMLAWLHRHFALAVEARDEHGGDKGTWLAGARKPGLDVQDPELPVADRAEAFVRERDHALLLVRLFAGDTTVQELTVAKVEIDGDIPARSFEVDGGGQRLRPVQQHAPMWEQLEQAVLEAEARSLVEWHAAVASWAVGDGPPLFLLAVRPSKRR